MKRSEFKNGLAEYLVQEDRYLALNLTQARTLAKHILKYCNKVEMIPPNQYANANELRFEWEDENE